MVYQILNVECTAGYFGLDVNQSVLGIVKTTNNVITLMEHATTDVKMGILDQTVQKVVEYFYFYNQCV